MKVKVALMQSGLTQQARTFLIDGFQQNKDEHGNRINPNDYDFLVGTYRGIGTGLTLTIADELLLMEVDYVCREEEQMMKRVVRIGQLAKIVRIFRLLCLEAPIEQACLLRRQARLDIMTGVLREVGEGVEVIMTTGAQGTGKDPIVL